MSTPIPVIETAKKIKQGEIPMDKKIKLHQLKVLTHQLFVAHIPGIMITRMKKIGSLWGNGLPNSFASTGKTMTERPECRPVLVRAGRKAYEMRQLDLAVRLRIR